MKPKSALRSFLAIAGSSLLAMSSAHALTYYWDGTSATWNSMANWSTDAAGTTDPLALPLIADDLIFNITGLNTAQNITLDANQAARGLTFNTTGATNIRGNSSGTTARTLTLGAGGINLAVGAGPVTIGESPLTYGAVNITLNDTQTWANSSSSLLTVNSDINLNGKTLFMGANQHISGNITGTGTLDFSTLTTRRILSGTNSFTSNLLIRSAGSSAVGILAVTSILDSTVDSSLGKNNTITIGTGSASAGRLEYIGTATSSSNRTFIMGGTGNANAQIYNNGTGVLTFTAGTFVNSTSNTRTLVLGGSNTGNNEIQGGINNTGGTAVNLNKTDTGTWVLSGSNSYNGSTSINGGGTLALDYATNASVLNSVSALALGGGTLRLTGKTGAFTTAQTLASLSTTANTISAINLIPNGGTSTTLTITSATLATGGGSTVNFNYLAGGAGTTNGSTIGNAIVAWNPTLTGPIIGAAYTVTDAGGSGYATVGTGGAAGKVIRYADPGGVGLVRTGGVSTTNYFIGSGYSTSDATIAGSLVESLTGNVVANTVTVDTTGLASGANLNLGARTLTLTATGGMLFSGANPYTIDFTGAGGITSTGSSTITLNNFNTSSAGVTLNAPILNATAVAVNFAGTGKTVLNGLNTYTGATNIGAGTLQIGGSGSLAAGTYAPAISIATGGTFQYSSSAAQTLSGIISGGGGLIKDTSTSSTLTLSNTNTYIGGTTLTAGTLSVASINDGGVAGGLGQAAAAAANIVFDGGTLKYTGANAISNRAFTINANKTATIDTTNDISFAGATGTTTNGALTKTGGGKLTLTGINTYTGTTTITGGTLALGASGSIASSPTIIVGATTTFDVSAVSGGYTLGADQTLSGTGSVVGAMTVAGTLSPGNSPGIMPTVGQTWVNGGNYNFQMLDATGVAGTGFDQIQVTGTLGLTGLTTGGFSINLWSLSSVLPDVNGNALNFDNTLAQSWTILTTSGGISGFDVGDFLVNVGANNGTTGFLNALGGGSFFLSATSNNLVLNFDAIPEPNVAALIGGFGMLALLRRRR